MLKNDILDLIESFEKETWKYINIDDKFDENMEYIYLIEKEIRNINESEIKHIYDRLIALIGVIRFKYGFESVIINNLELVNLQKIIESISLGSDDIVNQYNYVKNLFNDYIEKIDSMDFIKNNYLNIQGKEGLYIAVESLKSLITNTEYRKLLDNNQIYPIIIDCIKLNMGVADIRIMEQKYKEIIKLIWEQSISNKLDEDGNFRFLFSNISGGELRTQANLLLNRPKQSSCSMISSNFIATYGSSSRKIGFIYPNNSNIIMASAYDLGSNVFGTGVVNKEKRNSTCNT